MYEIKSIPTRYKGIVFRSRLEAYCYDYLINSFPEFDTMYEEELPFLEWVPDFMMVDYKHKFIILVEVKPDDNYFEPDKYKKALDYHVDSVALMTSESITFVDKIRMVRSPLDDLYWKRAYVNVKSHKNDWIHKTPSITT